MLRGRDCCPRRPVGVGALDQEHCVERGDDASVVVESGPIVTRMPLVVVVGRRVPMGQRLALPIFGRQFVDVGGRRKRRDCERRSQDEQETPKKRHHRRHRTTPEVPAGVPTPRDLDLSIEAGRQIGCRSRCRRALVEENAY